MSKHPKPPLHFHPYQDEYVAVVEGALGLTLGTQERVLRPGDGEICIPAWTHHRIFPVPVDEGGKTRFFLAGQETEKAYRLDTGFLQNWYGYQDEVVMVKRGKMDMVQVLCVSGSSFKLGFFKVCLC